MEHTKSRELNPEPPVVRRLRNRQETVWINPRRRPFEEVSASLPLTEADIRDAADRLERFAPLLARLFPETAPARGLIESPITEIPRMREALNSRSGADIRGRLLLKRDDLLPVAGSVKARGGVYEVLKHAETLAFGAGLLKRGDDYARLASPEARRFFSGHSVHVGSTGNLGLSIGIMSAALGFSAVVHMSADAKGWKKELLRSKGVRVIEYADDYSRAVEEGRRAAGSDPAAYFVDDENSRDLFLGYAAAAERLKGQLAGLGIVPDEEGPLVVTIPCGVGGAPCGITFGLKHAFGDAAVCLFAEPTEVPCMTLGLATGLHDRISVTDIGLTGKTAADGLAVGRPSAFAGKCVEALANGAVTVEDGRLEEWLRTLWETEGIFVEPSACAAFQGPVLLSREEDFLTPERRERAVYLCWATGGSMVPEEERARLLGKR